MHSNVKKYYANLSRSQQIEQYRKKNARIRHEYYSLCEKHVNLKQYLFTFTASGKGRGVYTKLRLINEIKSYITYLIANSNSELYFFSNIELGHSLINPHLHTQIWSDDKDAVKAIYDKVIEKFYLNEKHCILSTPHQNKKFYNYVIKDYAKDLDDNYLWNLEETKKRIRKTMGKQLRFYSKSKSKYSSKLYKIVYFTYGVIRSLADKFLDFFFDNFIVSNEQKKVILSSKNRTLFEFKSSFISIKNKWSEDVFFLEKIAFVVFARCRSPPCELLVRMFILILVGFYVLCSIVLWFCLE